MTLSYKFYQILYFIPLVFLASCSFQSPYEEWLSKSGNDMRLLPKYGGVNKEEGYKKADEIFIKEATKMYGNRKEAANYYANVGYKYAWDGDLKTGMYRLNQAWLLDSTNAYIYRGFGHVYRKLGEYELAIKEFDKGLEFEPGNEGIIIEKDEVQTELLKKNR